MEKIIQELDQLGKRLYEKFGTDSYEERCKIHDIKELLKGQKLPIHNVSGSLPELSVWCCEHGTKCNWIGFHGALQWGRFEKTATYEWRKKHKEMCGGKLIYLHEGNDR